MWHKFTTLQDKDPHRRIMRRKTNLTVLTKAHTQKNNNVCWKATVERQRQKSQFEGTEHILSPPPSFAIADVRRPLVTWLRIDSDPRASGVSGLSSRAAETACGLTRSALPWSRSAGQQQPATGRASSQPASQPAQPAWYSHTLFGVSAREPCWEQGLAVLLTGLRWTADGAFCPLTPGGHTERVGVWGRQVRLCSTCCPPHYHPPPPTSTLPSAQGPGQMPATLILKEAETKADEGNAVKRRRKRVGAGGGAPRVGSQRIWSRKSAQWKSIAASCGMQIAGKASSALHTSRCMWFPPLI